MKPLSLLALTFAAALLPVACNARRVGDPAPALSGGEWLPATAGSAEGGEAPDAPEIDGRWVLVEFFAPT
jgi:hypothetical protein